VRFLGGGGEVFPSLFDALRAARSFIHIELYMLVDDPVGETFAALLCERARAGVQVRLLLDHLGSFDLGARLPEQLLAAGVEVALYRPIEHLFAFWKWHRRNHRKLFVIDGAVGYCLGLNIGRDYESTLRDGGGWADCGVRCTGPVVSQMDELFRDTWRSTTHAELAGPQEPRRAAPTGRHHATLIASRVRSMRSLIRLCHLHAFRSAQRTIFVANAYFLPDPALVRALVKAAQRGVDVRVLIPGERVDVRLLWYASRRVLGPLLAAGVRVFEYEPAMLHAKLAIVDGIWMMTGSYNLDPRSRFHNLDADVLTLQPDAVQRAVRWFFGLLKHSHPLGFDAWRRRPLITRIIERAIYWFRNWL